MKRRKLWAAAMGFLLIVGAVVWSPAFRPLEMPQWQRDLERRGVQFYSVPDNPDLSVCFVLLQMEAGMQQTVHPALFVRNEGWSSRLSEITLHGTKDNEQISYEFSMPICCSPDEWGDFDHAQDEVVIPGHSYTVIMSAVDELPAVMGDFERSYGEELLPPFAPIDVTSPSLQMTVDSERVTIEDVDWYLVSAHYLRLVPYFYMA